MNSFREIINDLNKKKENVDNGGINAIPFNLPSLTKYVPGIVPELNYGITASSGVGKSKISRALFMFGPYDYYMKHKETKDLNLKIHAFCLEDNVAKTKRYLLLKALYEHSNIRLNEMQLSSYVEEGRLTSDHQRAIEKIYPFLEDMEKIITFYDESSPSYMLSKLKDSLLAPGMGSFTDSSGNKISRDQAQAIVADKNSKERIQYDHYHNNTFNIVIVDNLQNIKPEKGQTKYEALDRFTREIVRDKLCNFYRCTTALVQQQNQESVKKQFTNFGDSVVEKLRPSVAGLGEFKNSVQTMHCLMGLFSPAMFNVRTYNSSNGNYDIDKLGSYFKELSILKSNFSASVDCPLFCDPVAETFNELPPAKDGIGMQKVYDRVQELEFSGTTSSLF